MIFFLEDRFFIIFHISSVLRKKSRHDKVKQRPQFRQAVLDRSTRQPKAVLCMKAFRCLGAQRICILNKLCLIQKDGIIGLGLVEFVIASDQRICGDPHIILIIKNLLHTYLRASLNNAGCHMRRKFLKFLLPVVRQ